MSWSLGFKSALLFSHHILHINFLAHVKGPFITASSVLVNHRHMNQSKRSPKAWLKFAYFQKSETCASLVDQHSLIFSSSFFFAKSLDLHIKMPAVLPETIFCLHISPPAISSLLLTLHLFVFSVASSSSHMVSQLLLSSLAQNAEETILPVNIQSQSSLNGPIMGPSPKVYF